VDLSRDVIDWKQALTSDEQLFFSTVLAYFSASDGIVNENIATKFCAEVAIAEARNFYGFQIAMYVQFRLLCTYNRS